MQQNIPNLSCLKSKTLIHFECPLCSIHFTREVRYVKRKLSNGQKVFCCSSSCSHAHKSKIHKERNTINCKQCDKIFIKDEPDIKFCSVSCSNSHRKHSEITKQKISNKIKENNNSANKTRSFKTILRETDKNLYCTVFLNSCKNCNFIFSSKSYNKYCHNCKSSYAEYGRSQFRFKFNIYDYPNLFDLNTLSKIGWKSRRGDQSNPNGYTRDHRVSVADSLRFGYDPFYITHPLNCELMLMIDNQRKHSKSSITYEELVLMVDSYESNL